MTEKTSMTFYLTAEQKENIKNIAVKEGCSPGDLILSKVLNLKLNSVKEEMVYEYKKYRPKRRKKIN